ncbi:hypothetical protein [Gemmatimonas sp.]|uniref:hypothetical protein n=1 Tax=Gemmatimonas sp. TaxID=1962908 RepID=UPI003DA50D68
MQEPGTPRDPSNSSPDVDAQLETSGEKHHKDGATTPSPSGGNSKSVSQPQLTHASMSKLPRRLRRRTARDQAKRQKRSDLHTAQQKQWADTTSAPFGDSLGDQLQELLASKYRTYRRSVQSKACTPPHAIIDPGLVMVRGSGEQNDDRVMLSVFKRVAHYCGKRDTIAVCILDGEVYDALPIEICDPFKELRESPLTGRSACDEVFGATIEFYYTTHTSNLLERPILTEEHGYELLQHVREAASAEAWRYPDDTAPLSTLAQRVLLFVLCIVHEANKSEPLDEVRHLIDHGRFLELIDPRDGPV